MLEENKFVAHLERDNFAKCLNNSILIQLSLKFFCELQFLLISRIW